MWIFIFLRKWFFLTLCSIQPTVSIINIQRDLWELKTVDKVSFIRISQNVAKFLLFKLALEYRYTAIITLVSLDSFQFSSVAQLCLTLWPHEPQHARPPCPSPTLRVYPYPCPLSWWCHLTISSSVIPFSSCLQSFPTQGFFRWVSSSHHVAKILEFQLQHQSFHWIFRTDFL